MKKIYVIAAFMFAAVSNAQWTAVNNGLGTTLSIGKLAASGSSIYCTAGSMSGYTVFVSYNAGVSWQQTGIGLPNADVKSLASSGNTVYVGTGSSGIFVSANGGATWTASNSGLTNLNVNAIAVSGSSVFAGTYGGIFMSADNGVNWSAMNNGLVPTQVDAILFKGSSIFAGCGSMVGSNGIYISNDNAGSWSPVNNGLTYMAVQGLATNGSQVFAAPTGGGVFSTSNNGGNWAYAGNGLPSPVNIYGLTYANGALFGGTNGNGIYFSENSGVSWTQANAGLTNLYVYTLVSDGTNVYAGTGGGGIFSRPLSQMLSGVYETENETCFTLAPNPLSSLAILSFNSEQVNTRVSIRDILGRDLRTFCVNGKTCVIEKGALQPGVSYIIIEAENSKPLTGKILVE